MKTRPLFLLVFFLNSLCFAEVLYVSALKGKLFQENSAASQVITEISRGEAITVKKVEGPWLQVTYKNKTGWISKLFTTKTPPLKDSDVTNLKQLDADKVGRVRLNYENKGAARGLTDSGPKISRSGFQDNQRVYEGMKYLEDQNLSKEEIQNFQSEGNLKP